MSVPTEREHRASEAARLVFIVREAETLENEIKRIDGKIKVLEEEKERLVMDIMDYASEYAEIAGLSCHCEFLGRDCEHECSITNHDLCGNFERCPSVEPFHLGLGEPEVYDIEE